MQSEYPRVVFSSFVHACALCPPQGKEGPSLSLCEKECLTSTLPYRSKPTGESCRETSFSMERVISYRRPPLFYYYSRLLCRNPSEVTVPPDSSKSGALSSITVRSLIFASLINELFVRRPTMRHIILIGVFSVCCPLSIVVPSSTFG